MVRRMLLTALGALALVICFVGTARSAEKLTSEQVLRRCADTYKTMRTYYEESDLIKATDLAGKHSEIKEHIVTAFKRPAPLVVKISDNNNVTFYFDGKTLIVYNPAARQYVKHENVTLQQIAQTFEYPLTQTAIADDPYAALISDANKIGELKEAKLNGADAYEIDFDLGGGATVSNYFDKTRFVLIGVRATFVASPDQGGAVNTVTLSASKLLIDETPKDAAGKAVDVFAFALPPEAKETQPGQPEADTKGLKGQPAPDWTLKDASGRDVHLADLKGKTVLLGFWGASYGVSVGQMADVMKLADAYRGLPFAFYAVDSTDDAAAMQAFLKNAAVAPPALVGGGTTVSDDYRIVALPTYFVIDKGGAVSDVFVGVTKPEDLKGAIDRALAVPVR